MRRRRTFASSSLVARRPSLICFYVSLQYNMHAEKSDDGLIAYAKNITVPHNNVVVV